MKFKESNTIKDILIALINKEVIILLKSGKEYSGIIKTVGVHCMVLEQTDERSFFDAIISIDDISTVETKVRS